jgi:hypothetical protein
LLLGEMAGGDGGGSIPLGCVLMVAAVFTGAGTVGLLVAYGFLRKPLGLFRRQEYALERKP